MFGNERTKCGVDHFTTVHAVCAHYLYLILHFFFLFFYKTTLYLSRLVRTSCAICFIIESTINLRQFELLTFMFTSNVFSNVTFQHVSNTRKSWKRWSRGW